jgi:hypothetical protein
MAADLNPGFTNNINTIAVRAQGTVNHIYTDRAIDLDGDGVVEKVTIVTTPHSASVASHVVISPSGVARSIVKQSYDSDGGVDKSGSEFTEGVT